MSKRAGYCRNLRFVRGFVSVAALGVLCGVARADATIVWVSPTGSETEPYDTAATGLKTLTDALTYLRTLNAQSALAETPIVKLDTGTYTDYNHTLDFPIEVLAEGRVVTFSGDCRFFVLNHAQAVLDGIKVVGKTNMGTTYKTCLTVTKGVARNCTFSGWGSANGAVVTVNGGRLESSTFGVMYGYGAWKAAGVSVTSGGVVSNCVFNGTQRMETCWYVNGGTIQYSTMTNCQTCAHGHGNLANNLVIMRSGAIENCLICRSGYTDAYEGSGSEGYPGWSKAYGTVCVFGGTLRNCLIYGNTAKQYPGVGLHGGKMVNCTIGTHKGVSSSSTGVGLDLYLKGGVVVNSVVCGNPLAADGGVLIASDCTAVATNSAFARDAQVEGYGNAVITQEEFVDAAKANYRLVKSSGLRDTCDIDYDVFTSDSVDLDGNARIQNVKMEPGCYELEPLGDDDVVMRVDLLSSTLNDDYSSTKTYAIVLSGPKTTGFSYDWRLDDVTVGTDAQLTYKYVPGLHALRAIATRGKLALTNDVAVSVLNKWIYVSPKGSNTAPYDSWERALTSFTDIPDVLAEGGDAYHEVIVSNASYSVGKNVTFARNCHVHGFGGKPILTVTGTITVGGEQTEFSEFWIKNSCNNMLVTAGYFHDIEMSDRGLNFGDSPALRITGGRVSRLYSHGFSGGYAYDQVPVIVAGGFLDDFVIAGCTGCEAGLVVTGGTVSNGVIRGMQPGTHNDNLWQNSLSVRGGLVTHCVITNNGSIAKSHYGAVDIAGGTLRNCLIAGNRGRECAGICMVGCQYHAVDKTRVVENCTVIVNDGDCPNTERAAYGSCLYMPKGTVRNCVFYTRETKESDKYYIRKTGGTMNNCWVSPGGLDPTVTGEKIIVGTNLVFKSVNGWELIPAEGSPLIGKGANEPWMTGSKDLAGEERIRGRRVDIGAFEGCPAGMILLLR